MTNVSDVVITDHCVGGQLTVYVKDGGGTDTIFIKLPSGWETGKQVNAYPITSKTGFLTDIDSILSPPSSPGGPFSLSIFGLYGSGGFEDHVERRLHLTRCK